MSATSISHLLDQAVEVRRRQVADDGMGGQDVAWRTVATVPARVSSPPTSTTQGTLAAQQTMEQIPYYVYLEPDASVYRGDVLVEADGKKLWVEAITRPSVHAYQRAGCREWQAEPSGEAG